MSMVRVSLDGPIGVLTLSRPERHNSLVPDLLIGLIEGHREIVDRGATVGVLTAAGPTFSTGGDIKAIREADDREAYARHLVGLLNEAVLEIAFGPIPMVAAVHGMLTGGSVGLVLACDRVVLAAETTIRSWYATVGFAPDGGWTALLPGIIGVRRAAAVLLADDTITPAEALAWGVVHEVTPGAAVRDRALETARRIAGTKAGARDAIRRLTAEDRSEVAARLEAELAGFVAQVTTDESTAGMDAFLRGELR